MIFKKVLTILFFVPVVMALFSFPVVKAADSISVSGDWEVEYEIDDSSVTETGGNADVKVYVKNTSASNTIYYASIDLGAGLSSHFYQNDPILDLAPGLSVTLKYTVPISADDVGKSMNMWVAMSQGSLSDVDGIGVTQVVIGEPANYQFTGSITADKELVDKGDNVRITTTVRNTGNRTIDIEVIDMNSDIVGVSLLAPGAGISFNAQYSVNNARTFSCKVRACYPGTSSLIREINTNSVTVNIRVEENIDFSTSLSADFTEIVPMTTVNFTVTMINSGDDTINTFEIRNTDGELVASTEGMTSGSSGSVNIPLEISESCDIKYSVKAIGDSTNVTKETNAIHITIVDADTTTAEEATALVLPTIEPETTEEIQTNEEKADGINNTTILLIVIIGILTLLVAVMSVFVIKMVKKQTDEKKTKDNYEE
ncbi:MAG: hypothetical protein AB1Z23_05285 [Eubacteriales bacterium]